MAAPPSALPSAASTPRFGSGPFRGPCWELFEIQSPQYRESVWPPAAPALTIEAGRTLGWHGYGQRSMMNIGVDRFGASAPGEEVMRAYGLNVEQVCERALQVLRGV